jgi:aspartyl-tRNA(Asn)/glutamyl-tRNA(Gln) amidotransferase subunit B
MPNSQEVESKGVAWEYEGFELVVGLEVHTELKTRSKLFCSCANEFGKTPNTNVCPICLGLPGTLPVLNKQVVELAIKIGLALNCNVRKSTFHRKNYFYPDLPKGYQISQYDLPINSDGYLDLPSGSRVGVVRAHIEEDTGKISHMGASGRMDKSAYSLIDYNRAGVPLTEIVSAPDIRSPEQAREYVHELRQTLVALGVSDGRMEEGSLRVDANVSVRPIGSDELRTRCEIKNLNSLRSLVRAIDYEGKRHVKLYQRGESPVQETRHWDEARQRTGSLRSKEEANDYRYFLEPDLMALAPSESLVEKIMGDIVDTQKKRREFLKDALRGEDMSDQIEKAIDFDLYPFVSYAIEQGVAPRLAVARTANELAALVFDAKHLTKERFVEVLRLEDSKEISPSQAKTLLLKVAEDDRSIEEIVISLDLKKADVSETEELVLRVKDDSPKEWERFLEGQDQLIGFFVGKVMKLSSGKADGALVKDILLQLRAESK